MSSTVSVISSRKLHAVEKVLVLDGVPFSFSIQPLNEKFKIFEYGIVGVGKVTFGYNRD